MVSIIQAFQRGELTRVRMEKGTISAVIPMCVAHADFEAGEKFTGKCGVELADGTQCGNVRGHKEGRHGVKARAARGFRREQNAA